MLKNKTLTFRVLIKTAWQKMSNKQILTISVTLSTVFLLETIHSIINTL